MLYAFETEISQFMKKLFAILTLVCTASFLPASWSQEDQKAAIHEKSSMKLEVHQGKDVVPLLPLLNTWVADSFGPFPYLYAPPEGQVVSLGDFVYLNEKNALVITVKKEGKVIAVAGATALDAQSLALLYWESEFDVQMQEKGYDISDYLYVNYFLVAPEYRNDLSVIEPIYNTLVDFAHKTNKNHLTYIDVQLAENHPMKPEVYSSPEPWGTVITGFTPMDLYTVQEWLTYQADGTIVNQPHTLRFFRKSI